MNTTRASRPSAAGWLIGALILCAVHTASAQVEWGLGRWRGDAILFSSYENQDNKSLQMRYETILTQERLGLRNEGAYLLDPRFLTLNLGGSFGGSQQESLTNTAAPLSVGNGTLSDYAFDALFLRDQPYIVRLFATRSENILTQGFGTQSNTTLESQGGIFELREDSILHDYGLLNFSSLLDVHQEILNQDSSTLGTLYLQDETRNVVKYNASKGGETSDTTLNYEFDNVSDPDVVSDNFDSNLVRLANSFDFGPTLNRRLDSFAYYFNRSGNTPGTFLSVGEGLRLDHSSNLASFYRYDFTYSSTDTGVIDTHNASVGLFDVVSPALTTTLDARGSYQTFPNGNLWIAGAQNGVDYRLALPGNGLLSADTSLGYQVTENNFTSSLIQVIDEPHLAPPVIGGGAGFFLNNAFVEIDTTTNCLAGSQSGVVDVRGGSRLQTTCNIDYILSQDGSLTKIIPLPSSAIIQPNDPLEVTYNYNIAPNITFSTTTADIRTGVDFPWFGAWYEHSLSDQTKLSGEATTNQFLINSNLDHFRFEVRHQWDGIRFQVGTAYDMLKSTVVNSDALRFDQLLLYQPFPDIVAQLNGDQFFIDYPGEGRQTQSALVRATINWFTPIGLTLSGSSGYRRYTDTGVATEDIYDAGAQARWTFQNTDVAAKLTWTDYTTRLNDVLAELRITRHLF